MKKDEKISEKTKDILHMAIKMTRDPGIPGDHTLVEKTDEESKAILNVMLKKFSH